MIGFYTEREIMELAHARLILENTSPLPFIGFFVAPQHAPALQLSLQNYSYVIIDPVREHYSLAGRLDGQHFQFDSAYIQKRPICALYVILFSWLSPQLQLARGLFSRLSQQPTPNDRNVTDLLICDTVQRALDSLQCL